MKMAFSIFIIFIVFVLGSCLSKPATQFPSAAHLSEEAATIIKEYDTVNTYLVTIDKQPQQQIIGEKYGILDTDAITSKASIIALQHYLLTPEHFRFSPIKKFLFLPEYAFEFTKDGKTVLVLVSLSYQQVEFIFDGIHKRGDIEVSAHLLKHIIKGDS